MARYTIEPDEQDVRRAAGALNRAMQVGAAKTLIELSLQAKRFLYAAYREEGWYVLAPQWDATAPTQSDDGGIEVEVFNQAENKTFFDKTTRPDIGRVRSSKYPIQGADLIRILEHGAKPHPIDPNDPGSFLAFPGPHSNLDQRTQEHANTHAPGSFLAPLPGEIVFRRHVDHPGVTGAKHLEAAEDFLGRALDRADDQIVANVAAAYNDVT